MNRAFQSLLSEVREWKPNINGLRFASLETVEARSLEYLFSEEGVALSSLSRDKALRLDHFTMALR